MFATSPVVRRTGSAEPDPGAPVPGCTHDPVCLDRILADPCTGDLDGAWWARMRWDPEPGPQRTPAGPFLTRDIEIATDEPDALDTPALLAVVVDVERQDSWQAARRHRAVAAYADRYPPGTSAVRPGAGNATPVARWLPDELGMALGIAPEQALGTIRDAQRMVHVLGDTLDALGDGRIDRARADTIRRATDHLDPGLAREVEAVVLPHAGQATRRQVYDRCRRAVAHVDPDGARERHERSLADRRVAVRATDDGMAEFWMSCSAVDAQASWEVLTRLARSLGTEDPRTLDQRRVDLAHQLIQGTTAVTGLGRIEDAVRDRLGRAASTPTTPTPCDGCRCGGHHGPTPDTASFSRTVGDAVARVLADRPDPNAVIGRKPLVQVVVGLDTLQGGDTPGELDGHGPVPATVARAIAAGGTWQQMVVRPETGYVHSVGRRRFPSPAIADHVRARDRVCRGCGRRIRELDHHESWGRADGETCVENLNGYCRRCHVLKEQPGWQVLLGTDGSVTWLSPNGATRTTWPWDHSDHVEPDCPEPDCAQPDCAQPDCAEPGPAEPDAEPDATPPF